jgi:hypothetical protein
MRKYLYYGDRKFKYEKLNRKNRPLIEIIMIVFLFIVLNCSMGGPGFRRPGGMGRMMAFRNASPVSIVYHVQYDKAGNPYIRLYYNIFYSGIIFYREDSLYKAKFNINVYIKAGEEIIVNKTITKSLTVEDYSATVSSDKVLFGTFEENLSAGKNVINISIRDENSDREYEWERSILVPAVKSINTQN